MKQFKYKTTFQARGHLVKQPESEKTSFASVCATASDLSGLKSLLPSKEEAEKNSDFLYATFNLALGNSINLNDDGMRGEDLVKMAKNVKFKQVNIEHSRENIVGVLTGAAFSTYGENQLIGEEDAFGFVGPFNLAVSAVIWKVAGDIWQTVEESTNPESPFYQAVSSSWEVGFDNYGVAIGSKNLSRAIVLEGEEAEPYMSYLRCNGGTGFTDKGEEIYRVIMGEPMLLGAGLTLNPAAAVKGILTLDPKKDEEEEDEDDEDEEEVEDSAYAEKMEKAAEQLVAVTGGDLDKTKKDLSAIAEAFSAENHAIAKKIENTENKTSILDKPTVIIPRTMKFNKIEDVYASLDAAASEEGQAVALANAVTMRAFLESAMVKADERYVAEQTAKAEAQRQLEETLAESQKMVAELESVKTALAELQSQAKAKEAQDIFDARMSELTTEYNLEDSKVRSVIAKHINELDEEGYQFWLENDGQVILAGYKKQKESVNPEDASKSLSQATASVDIPNAQATPEENKTESLFDLVKEISFSTKKF